MRAVITSLFVALVLALTFSKVGVVGFYHLNKAYVAQNLCVNKAKPALKCDGKCYLRKNIQSAPTQQAPSTSTLPEILKNISSIVFFQAAPCPAIVRVGSDAPLQYGTFVESEPVAVVPHFTSRLAADKPWHPPAA